MLTYKYRVIESLYRVSSIFILSKFWDAATSSQLSTIIIKLVRSVGRRNAHQQTLTEKKTLTPHQVNVYELRLDVAGFLRLISNAL